MSKRRQQMLRHVKAEMRARGELEPTDWDAPKNSTEARRQAMKAALEETEGRGETRQFTSTESFDDRMDRAYEAYQRKMEIKRAKRRMVKRETRALRQQQMAAGADARGILYSDVGEGMPCKILPREYINDQGALVPMPPDYDAEVSYLPAGTIVTALFNVKICQAVGNKYVKCMLSDGRHVNMPKYRLQPLFGSEVDAMDDGWEDEEDLFEPEEGDGA